MTAAAGRLRVVLTHADGGLDELPGLLAPLGVEVVARPLLAFAPPADWAPLDAALDRLADFAAVACTSPRAAQALEDRLARRAAPPAGPWPRVWAAGEASAAPLRRVFPLVALPTPAEVGRVGAAAAVAACVTGALAGRADAPVLFPAGDRRRDELPERLQAAGLAVHEVTAYRTCLVAEDDAREALAGAAVVVATSPSVARLVARSERRRGPRPALVAIGPSTAGAARAEGWEPLAVASRPTAAALADAVRSAVARYLPPLP